MDFALPYFVGEISRLEDCGIDTDGLRKSLDGTQAIVHMHNLTIEQFNEVRTKTSITAYTHEQAQEVMKTAEWNNEEI